MPRPLLIAATALLFAGQAAAHPLPNFRFDREVRVRLTPTAVVVRYTLDINEWTLVFDGRTVLSREDEGKAAGNRREYAKLYAARKGQLMADGLRATVGEKDLDFQVEKADIEPDRDHLVFKFTFRADWRPPAGRQKFTFADQNFEDKSGAMMLTVEAADPLKAVEIVEPTDLNGKSPLLFKPGDDERSRRAEAVFDAPASAAPAAGPAQPPPSQPEVQVVGERPGFVRDLWERGLTALFDSGYGVGVLLLIAALFGAAHAFTPGHGKTLVAAYLVGERGTIRHALVLGLTTTIAHTGSVILIAMVLWSVYRDNMPRSAEGWLQLAGGLLIFGVGLWLLSKRIQGKADHVHLFGDGHHHHHDHDHGHHHHHHHAPADLPAGRSGWLRVVLLGIGGGIIPCWDAVMLLVVAVSAGRLAFAVPMLLAFSVGLAAVLVGLGVGVVLAHRAGGRRFGERRWFRALPVVSAALLVGMGLWLGRDGWQKLSAASHAPPAAPTAG